MGYEIRKLCQAESKKLLWLIGVVFAMVLAVQFFEFPYGNGISSLLSANKVTSIANSHTGDSPINPKKSGNLELLDGFDDSDAKYESSDMAVTSKSKEVGPKTDLVVARNESTVDFSELDEDLGLDEEFVSSETLELSKNSTLVNVEGYNSSAPALENATVNRTVTAEHKDVGPKTDPAVDRNETASAPSESDEGLDLDEESVSSEILELFENSTLVNVGGYNSSVPSVENATVNRSISANNVSEENVFSGSGQSGRLNLSPLTPPSAPQQTIAMPPLLSPENVDTISKPTLLSNPNNSPSDKGEVSKLHKKENSELSLDDRVRSGNSSLVVNVPSVKDIPKNQIAAAVPISEMNDMLLESHTSYRSMKPRWSSSVDQELLHSKSLLGTAPIVGSDADLYAPLYRNLSTFKRSYELMEQTLKVFVYPEGVKPIFHQPVLKGIYASEGWFMRLLKANKKFVSKNSRKAHLFYLPFSSRMLEETLYVPNSHSRRNLVQCLKDYLGTIAAKYPFWNRTGGSDHFLVACHDWAPAETNVIMAKCIRSLCNADLKEGFIFGKDASLPETYVKNPQNLLRELGGKRPSQRRTLAFFAGNMHGYLRPILLQHWENKDPDMKIFGVLPKVKRQMTYVQHMKSSKYCICARGFEVNSPRVVEAIFYECVPVILSDNFVPPFFEVLNWESFSVFVLEKDIPNLKNILLSIPQKRYLEMYRRVKQVQKHFLWHAKPVKYDIFHMILHSIWYNRVLHVNPR